MDRLIFKNSIRPNLDLLRGNLKQKEIERPTPTSALCRVLRGASGPISGPQSNHLINPHFSFDFVPINRLSRRIINRRSFP